SLLFCFFFSSRRRHTRFSRDWSSDVCSSDLVSYPREPVDAEADETRAYAMSLINGIKELLPINPLYGEELKHYLNRFSPHEPGPLTDFAAAITSAKGRELQDVLATLPVLARMQKVLPLLRKEIEVAQLQSEISDQVNAQMQ